MPARHKAVMQPELPLDVFVLQQPILPLNISVLQQTVLPGRILQQQVVLSLNSPCVRQHVLSPDIPILQHPVLPLDLSVHQQSLLSRDESVLKPGCVNSIAARAALSFNILTSSARLCSQQYSRLCCL
jgi:hypothetical protein